MYHPATETIEFGQLEALVERSQSMFAGKGYNGLAYIFTRHEVAHKTSYVQDIEQSWGWEMRFCEACIRLEAL